LSSDSPDWEWGLNSRCILPYQCVYPSSHVLGPCNFTVSLEIATLSPISFLLWKITLVILVCLHFHISIWIFKNHPISFFVCFCFFQYWTWTQGLHLEPLHQTFSVLGILEIGSFCPGWLWTIILLISASWVAGLKAGATIDWLILSILT
jgi:hypothetical protein